MWDNDALIVEKMSAERDARGDYWLRVWQFFGNRDICYKIRSHEPVIKGSNALERVYFEGVPEKLRRIRAEFGMDFGKFDYTVVDGEPILFDVNKTPGTPRDLSTFPQMPAIVENLSQGIESLCSPVKQAELTC